ncbi:MAG: D-alanyl-D-alanine carboxypeptidase [Bacteroidales bacterium]|nr:D-alanyl-D-alanine carboxypeptidase [Bacteroidales bacterium]
MFRILLLLALVSTPQQRRVEKILRENPALDGAVAGILAVNAAGDTLVSVNPSMRMVPASNIKLISSGAALWQLGAGWRFETGLYRTGDILIDGTLCGDLYIVGGGDPTLGARNRNCEPADSTFARWIELLREAGVSRIDGRVVGDGRAFDGQREHPTWSYEDIGTDYGAAPGGLNFCANIQDYELTPGLSVGEKPAVWPSYPDTPWMSFRNCSSTGAPGTGNKLYLYNTDLAPVAELRGTYAAGLPEKTIHGSNRFPALTCAHMFRKALYEASIPVFKGVADVSQDGHVRPEEGFPKSGPLAADTLIAIGSTKSVPLREIIRDLNHLSDNFYAEALLAALGKTMTGSSCADSSVVALRQVLAGMGLAEAGKSARIVDGSGLSRENYVSASFFVQFLRKMAGAPCAKVYLASLPRPGRGTLASRMARQSAALRERVRMKSGSMDGVRCFSGYVLPADGRLGGAVVFSVLVNNMNSRGRTATDAVDSIVAAIASD